jgi:hypothetical protein
MFSLASLRSDGWTTCPELVDDFVGIRTVQALVGRGVSVPQPNPSKITIVPPGRSTRFISVRA